MSDPNLLFQQAGTACERGDFAAAAVLYRQLLTQIPGHPQILSALGNAELGQGHYAEGVTLLRQSLAIFAAQPDAWCNLARGLRATKHYDEALAAADSALVLAPDLFEAWMCRGNIAWDIGQWDAALAAYDKAAQLRPNDPRAHFNRANALQHQKRYGEAADSFRRVLALAPDYPEAPQKLAILYREMRRPADALAAIDLALARHPDESEAHDIRGTALFALGRFDEALAALERAVALNPSVAAAVNNRGVIRHAAGDFAAALADFDRAIALDSRYADAMVNRGTLLRDLGRLDAAAASYDQALAVAPDHGEAHWSESLLALLQGDFAAGWAGYDGRWTSKVMAGCYLATAKPQWRGEDVAGKTIYIWHEQGFGDFIQFCRYVPAVAARGARVILQTPARLKPLIASLNGPFEMVEEAPADFDVQCPIMSLPLAFGTTVDSVPGGLSYLSADPAKTKACDAMLGPGPRIGLAWSASLANIYARWRHMPAEFLAPLLDLPAAFHGLQKEFLPQDVAFLAQYPAVTAHADAQNDFADAAALIAAMDLVITVDSVIAHLAGALGKPVWLMLPYAADWRWMLDRTDTPWYPSMRLFRQPTHGDWASVVRAVHTALADYLRR